MPDLSVERTLPGPVAGVDEVGRGPLAGPVLACAVLVDPRAFPTELGAQLRDSKKLTARRRRILADQLCVQLSFGLGAASVGEIRRLNILHAAMLAMRRALAALPRPPAAVLVDGNRDPGFALPAGTPVRPVVKGDDRCLSIAAASIIAKVVRDRQMAALASRWPGYGWERNAGYGTAAHREALARLGVTPHHRTDFAPVAAILALTEEKGTASRLSG